MLSEILPYLGVNKTNGSKVTEQFIFKFEIKSLLEINNFTLLSFNINFILSEGCRVDNGIKVAPIFNIDKILFKYEAALKEEQEKLEKEKMKLLIKVKRWFLLI